MGNPLIYIQGKGVLSRKYHSVMVFLVIVALLILVTFPVIVALPVISLLAPQSGAHRITPHRDFHTHTHPFNPFITGAGKPIYMRNGKSFKNCDSGYFQKILLQTKIKTGKDPT